MEIMMARPTFRLGSMTSEPLLVIVVKPLKASIPSAVAPRKLPVAQASPVLEKSTNRLSATHTPTTPKISMPPIFRMPMKEATP